MRLWLWFKARPVQLAHQFRTSVFRQFRQWSILARGLSVLNGSAPLANASAVGSVHIHFFVVRHRVANVIRRNTLSALKEAFGQPPRAEDRQPAACVQISHGHNARHLSGPPSNSARCVRTHPITLPCVQAAFERGPSRPSSRCLASHRDVSCKALFFVPTTTRHWRVARSLLLMVKNGDFAQKQPKSDKLLATGCRPSTRAPRLGLSMAPAAVSAGFRKKRNWSDRSPQNTPSFRGDRL